MHSDIAFMIKHISFLRIKKQNKNFHFTKKRNFKF